MQSVIGLQVKYMLSKNMDFGDTAEFGIPSNAIREFSLLRELNHPNIIKIEDIWYHRPRLLLYMEYMECDLQKYIEDNIPLPLSSIQHIIKNILEGVKAIHCSRTIHRDLKPANIFLNSELDIKIGDFSISRTYGVSSRPMTDEITTLYYRAPEVLIGMKNYSIQIDMWSWGCIFAELFLGYPLFTVDNESELILKIFKTLGTPDDDSWSEIMNSISLSVPKYPQRHLEIERMDDWAVDLLNRMLSINPYQRISAKEALKHSYFMNQYE